MSEVTRFFSKVDITDPAGTLRTVNGELMDMTFKLTHTQASTLEMLVHNLNDGFRTLYPEGSKVELYFDTFSPPTTKRFLGIIEHAEPFMDVGKNFLKLYCRERWHVLSGGKLVAETYANKEITAIVQDLISRYVNEVNATTFVDNTGITLEDIRFVYKPLKWCLDTLATIANFTYYVDPLENLHWKKKALVDSGITFSDQNVRPMPRFAKNIVPIKNVVYVVSSSLSIDQQSGTPGATFDSLDANYLAEKFTPVQTNIKQLSLYLEKIGSPNDLSGEIREDKTNSPAGGAVIATFTFARSYLGATAFYPIAIGEKPLDSKKSYWIVLIKTGDATNTYKWYKDAQANQTRATSTDNVTWTVIGTTSAYGFKQYSGSPIIARASDQTSINNYLTREIIVQDNSITSKEAARRLAKAKLAELKDVRKEFQDLTVYSLGSIPNPGELVTVNIPAISLNEQVEVREMEFPFPGGWRGGEYYIARLGLVAEELKYMIATITKELADERATSIDLTTTTLNRIEEFQETFPLAATLNIWAAGSAQHPTLNESLPLSETLSRTEKLTGTFVYGTAKYGKSDYA